MVVEIVVNDGVEGCCYEFCYIDCKWERMVEWEGRGMVSNEVRKWGSDKDENC